ncbi:ABC transporter permease [bacterium]|nr:ABC transporter permease [bacterium]
MKTLTHTVYTPDSLLLHPARIVNEMARDLVAGRNLAWQLAVREIRAQYRQTSLGLLWIFIVPLANTVTWVFIHKAGIVSIRDTTIDYPIYVFTGTLLWAIFMDALNAPLVQTSAARNMLAKINFPREALIISGLYQVFFNTGIKTLILFVALFFLGVSPSLYQLLFPFAALSLILAGTAIGLVVTPIGMLYRDVGKGLPFLMQFAMYITPVVFPMPTIGMAATIFRFNPLTPLLVTARDLATGMQPEHIDDFFLVTAMVSLILAVSLAIYRATMYIIIERLSS